MYRATILHIQSQNFTHAEVSASTLGLIPDCITKPGRMEHLLSKLMVLLDREVVYFG